MSFFDCDDGGAIISFEDDDAEYGWVDPFVEDDIDYQLDTGADWYRKALSASLGGLPVHGLTIAPACETLAKVTEEVAEKYAHGRIRYNSATRSDDDDDLELDYRPRLGKGYLPHVSLTQAVFAFEEEGWEPTGLTRAKNAAFVGALAYHGTGSLSEGAALASAVAGERIDEAVVEAVYLPLSYAKRETLVAAKHSHAIFTLKSWQSGATWHDQQLVTEAYSPDAAIDWGRITCIARYLAEVNLQYDPKFRAYAQTAGVPYQLIRGAWAYVSPSDAVLSREAVARVPMVDIQKFDIPSVNVQYANHRADMYSKILELVRNVDEGTQDAAADALSKMLLSLKDRKPPKKAKIATGTDIIHETTRQRYDAQSAAKAVANSATAWNAYTDAAENHIRRAPNLFQSAQKIFTLGGNWHSPEGHAELSVIVPAVLSQPVWLEALAKLTVPLDSPFKAEERLAKLKRQFAQSSVAWQEPVRVTKLVHSVFDSTAVGICKRAAVAKGTIPSFPVVARNADDHQGLMFIRELSRAAREHLLEFREAWARRYQDESDAYASGYDPGDLSVKYGTAARAFRMITPNAIHLAADGFIDMTVSSQCYLAKAGRAYARKRKLAKPRVPDNLTAAGVAAYLDGEFAPAVPFVDVEAFVRERLAMLADDIIQGSKLAVRGITARPERPKPVVEQDIVQPTDAPAASPTDALAAFFALMNAAPVIPKVTLAAVLRSYSPPHDPDEFARLNGYENIEAAFDVLKAACAFDPENEFCMKALFEISKRSAKEERDDVLA